MRCYNVKTPLLVVTSLASLLLFNEVLIYWLVLYKCDWPTVESTSPDERYTKFLIVADPHLLGVKRGHWFDKLRREWQMYMSFQSAVSLLRPEVVFFLGDLMDEGLLGPNELFDTYVQRFEELFHVGPDIRRYVVAGNHDIGFHDEIFPVRFDRFVSSFDLPHDTAGIKMLEVNGNLFVLVNSMAMERDGCRLCWEAEKEVEKISRALKCSRKSNGSGTECESKLNVSYSRPILLQHFPLFRKSDEECEEGAGDLAPESTLRQVLRPRLDTLSRESTRFLLDSLRPRAAFGGHSHYGCKKWWKAPDNLWEFTIPSLSWRNNHRPSIMLASISSRKLYTRPCSLPDEYLVLGIYILFFLSISFVLVPRLFSGRRSCTLASLKCALIGGTKVNLD